MDKIQITRSVSTAIILVVWLSGCASTGPVPELETQHYTKRMQSRNDGGVRVSTSVLSDIDDEPRYHTDGLRAVLFFVTRPLALSDIVILDWEPLLQ